VSLLAAIAAATLLAAPAPQAAEKGRAPPPRDPDAEMIEHLELLERMDLLQNLDVLSPPAPSPAAEEPPPEPPAEPPPPEPRKGSAKP
jgi:hypothetical protein